MKNLPGVPAATLEGNFYAEAIWDGVHPCATESELHMHILTHFYT
jgi:hypothetical protein